MATVTTSKAIQIAERLEKQAEDKLRDRETNTQRKLAFAMKARLEGNHMARAAEIARAYDKSQCLPVVLEKFKPSKAAFMTAARKKTEHVSKGFHGYHVEASEYSATDEVSKALRSLMRTGCSAARQRAEAQQKFELEANVQHTKIPGFFPTPLPIIDMMIEAAGIKPDEDLVLEPSAGKGDIMEAVLNHGCRECKFCEIHSTLVEILRKKGHIHRLLGYDFLEVDPGNLDELFDVALMNPPFEKGQDVVHVRHAYQFLRPGGRLVAIMSAGVKFRNDRKYSDFREWLEHHDGDIEELPEGAFAGRDSFNKTGVSSVMVTVDRR